MLTLKISPHTDPRLVEILNLLAKCHASETPIIAATNRLLDEYPHSDWKYRVDFYDGRFPLPSPKHSDSKSVARLEYEPAKVRWLFTSPRISIPGRGKNGKRRDYMISRAVKTTIKNVLGVLQPLTPAEIIETASGRPHGHMMDWVSAAKQPFERLTKYLSGEVLMEEIRHLHQQGVQFRTPQFAKMVSEGLPLFAEYKSREATNTRSTIVHVCVTPEERVLLTWEGRQTKTPMQRVYADYDALPDSAASKVALLRFSEQQTFIPEVGRRMSDTQFWLILTDEEVGLLGEGIYG
jgi:hypothetical protein